MTGRMPAIKGTPTWENVQRENSSVCGCTHSQAVHFVSGSKRYIAEWVRFYTKSAPQGQRVTYGVDVTNRDTGRRSNKLSDLMLASGWKSTFVNNVRAYAEAF